MQISIKPFIWAIASLSFLGFATRSLADATVPIEKALAQIQGKTQVPILIPSVVPVMRRIYVSGGSAADHYLLNFSPDPGCRGTTACNYAWIEGERGGALFNAADLGRRDTLEFVDLATGIHGQFANTCGSYCLAQVAWQSQGVLYKAVIKNGKKESAIALANSAIQGGIRKKVPARRVRPLPDTKATKALYWQSF